MRKLFVSLTLFFAALGPPGFAQSSGTITTTSTTCPSLDASRMGTVSISVSGTWSGTLTPEISVGGQPPHTTQVTPANSSTPQTSITADNVYYAAGGGIVSVCGPTNSGTATVALQPIPGSASGGGKGGGSGNSTAPTNTLPAAVTSINAYGDSITFGYGIAYIAAGVAPLTTSAQNYVSLFASHFGLTVANNYAYYGGPRYYGQQFIGDAYANSASNSVMSITRYGGNEGGDFPGGITQINLGIQAMLVWLSLPSSAFQLQSAMTKSGSGWTTGTLSYQTTAFTSHAGDSISGVANGTTVYVGASAEDGFGAATISIDGVSQGSFSFNNTTVSSPAEVPICYRFSGLSPGNHTILVTQTSGLIDVAWYGGNQGATQQPFTIVGAMLPHGGVSNTNIAAFNSAVQTTISNLASDGLNVLFINDNATVSPTAQPFTMQTDGIHPNEFGDQLIAKQWIQTFQPALTFPQPQGKGGDFLAQVLQSSGMLQGSTQTPADISSFINAFVNFESAKGLPWGWAPLDLTGALATVSLNTITSYGGIAIYNNGVPTENGQQVDLTSQTAAITNHALYTATTGTNASGLYRVTWSADITTADSTSSTIGGSAGLTVTFTSPTDSVSKTTPTGISGSTSSGNSTATAVGGSVIVKAKFNTPITFSFGYTAGTGNMAYELHVAIEAL